MSSPYDIVLLPSQSLANKAVETSQHLSSESAQFELDSSHCFPHVSLYMVQLKATNLERVQQILAGVAARSTTLALSAHHYGGSRGYINASYARTEALDRLQEEVIAGVNPLRDGLTPKETALQPTATGMVAENIEKYGFRSVGELYVPHLTLTRFTEHPAEGDTPIDTSLLPPLNDFSGQFPAIGLFEMGAHGTCIREVARMALQTAAA